MVQGKLPDDASERDRADITPKSPNLSGTKEAHGKMIFYDAVHKADKEKPMAVRTANIVAARAVADAVRTSLGPRGMDKMIQDGKGQTIVRNCRWLDEDHV
ncbi:putative T-complex protein 1 subunit delta [Glarea lozoyensis 74030]|uniref:Putative T-complex protein 1 subunit delta n=1 Tax=Glarea lozoyensis (strain ATCC 74030 / MF5533) TaxID=1104152 RepID=H0ERI7_GLAL7|nr:putative T-complex protein 1 subunit delta [Glarea lozoyensis 74030]